MFARYKMDIEVLGKDHEPLMNRTSFKAKIIFEGKTPSRLDLIKGLCQKLSSKEDLTLIRKITTDYGSERAILTGYFYDNEKAMAMLENPSVKLRHMTKDQRKAEKDKIKAAKQAAASAKKGGKKK
jgi:ribosomal protein S24E